MALNARRWSLEQPAPDGELPGKDLESRPCEPDAGPGGVDIGEETQDTVPVSGARGKCVDVQEVVAGAQPHLPP